MPPRRRTRAVPDRREQPRLSRLLRAPGVDRDLQGAAHERDLRLRLDAREDHLRVRRRSPRWWSGTRGCPGARRSTRSTRPAARSKPDLLAEQWPYMQPLVDAFGYENVRVEGYEADDVIATLAAPGARAGHRRDGRDRRPRPVPADRAGRAGDGHEPRDHRDEGLRPRGGDRPLRHPARADPRLRGAEGRHLGQHPRRPGDRREDRLAAAPGVRRRSRACWATSTASPAPSARRT